MLSETQIRWFRLRRSGLAVPFASPEAAASALVGVQAQILPAAGLALWNRTTGLTYAALDDLLYQERSLVKLWGQRHTLHLYPRQEWPLIIGALRGQRTWWERQAEQNGADMDGYRATIDRVAELLHERGTLGRSDLRAADLDLKEEHLSAWGGVFADLVRRGDACHAGQVGNEGRFAHREYWLPGLEWNPPPPEQANVELARRYLRTYGPATVHDFLRWRGLRRVGDARPWFAALGDEVAEVTVDGKPALALRADLDALHETAPPREAWPVRLLYRFDPLLLGHKDKAWIVDPEHYARVWRPAGHIEGTLLEQGRVAGTWRYDRTGGGLAVSVFPFTPLPAHVRAAVEEHAAGVARFLGLELVEMVVEE
ncbi:MAG: winged helix DNA-binding domain-containing protein [Ardenticatenaceae bacterium]|nr:winged helix DNA-binding domain-containing protein [Ardenticatenaceae bacterium]